MSDEAAERLSISGASDETRGALGEAALAVVASLIWDCRGVWPAEESEEERREQIKHSARFVYDSLFRSLQAHAAIVAAQMMAEKPEVSQ